MERFIQKQVAIFLSALLVASLLSACGSAPSAASSSPAPAASSSAGQSAPPVEANSVPQGVSPEAQAAYPAADITVDEDMYVNWVNELTWNCDLYLEKTVRIQGMYISEQPEGLGDTFSYVYRIGPGCCGTDGDLCGMQLLLPEGVQPAPGDWIDVYGTLRICELSGFKFLLLDDARITVDNAHRGLENVLHQL